MPRQRSHSKKAGNQTQVAMGIYVEGEESPLEVLLQPVPNDFPPKLIPHLAEYMARGFNYGIEEGAFMNSLGKRPRGRPIDAAEHDRGREAARLRKRGLTFGEIAKKLCPKRGETGHACDRLCADRLRHSAKVYLH
jgi:hypothetical protein